MQFGSGFVVRLVVITVLDSEKEKLQVRRVSLTSCFNKSCPALTLLQLLFQDKKTDRIYSIYVLCGLQNNRDVVYFCKNDVSMTLNYFV